MALIARRPATAPPLRQVWMLLLIAALTVALAVGLAIAGARLLRPPGPENLNTIMTVPVPTLTETWDAGTIEGLANPAGLDIGPDGTLYVANGGTGEILVISPSGTLIDRWGSKGAGPGQFDFQLNAADPEQAYAGLAVASDGSLYVADLVNDRVQQLTAAGDFIREWGSYGPGDGQFLEPYDVAVAPDGTVYVVDDRRDDIQQFTADGAHLLTMGRHGSGDGEMDYTGAIVVDGDGTVLNADFGNGRVQAFAPDGSNWAIGGSGSTILDKPADVDVDAHGNIYVTDRAGLKVFGPGHDLVSTWSYPLTDTTENYAMAVGPDGSVTILSREHSTIWRLALTPTEVDRSPEPSPVATAVASPSGATTSTPAPAGKVVAVGDIFAAPFTVELPARWAVDSEVRGAVELRLARTSDHWPAWVMVSIPLGIFADPCHPDAGEVSPPVGPTIDDLAEALVHMPGFRASAVTDAVIDGFPAKVFDLDNNIDMSTCTDQAWLSQWNHDGSTSGSTIVPVNQDLQPSHERVAIVDVNGTRVAIWTRIYDGVLLDEVKEAYQVFDSIDFQ